MREQMPVSKKLRFEVFKRDLFQCQYCGRTPPQVVLEVDHIIPRKKVKNDGIDNLITSCFDCNRGKSATPLSEAPEALSNKIAILAEKKAQLRAFDKFLKYQEDRTLAQIVELQQEYTNYYPGWCFSERFCQASLRRFLASLTLMDIKAALSIAASHYPSDGDRAIKYFCGICWNWIKDPSKRGGKPWGNF